jgi:flagellar FliJ protein
MARFRFNLEGLLKLRRLEEDRAKSAFLLRFRCYRLVEAEIAEIGRRREEAKARCRESSLGSLDMDALLRSRRFINVLFQRIEEKRAELSRLRPALEEARGAYRKAAARRKAIEKIRERRRLEFLREEDRREGRELDEVGGVGFIRAAQETARAEGGGES